MKTLATDETINVLYVDDEIHNLDPFKAVFRRYFNVFIALSAKEAELILAKNNIHVLITDQRMPETLGTELLAEAVIKYPAQTRILLSAYTDPEAIIDAINRGQIFKYLQKPWNEAELRKAIEKGYEMFIWKNEKIKASEDIKRSEEEISLAVKPKKKAK